MRRRRYVPYTGTGYIYRFSLFSYGSLVLKNIITVFLAHNDVHTSSYSRLTKGKLGQKQKYFCR